MEIKTHLKQEVSGRWTSTPPQQAINLLELRAIRLAFNHYKPKRAHIIVRTDNSTALTYSRKLYGRVERLHLEAKRLFETIRSLDTTLELSKIAGKNECRSGPSLETPAVSPGMAHPERIISNNIVTPNGGHLRQRDQPTHTVVHGHRGNTSVDVLRRRTRGSVAPGTVCSATIRTGETLTETVQEVAAEKVAHFLLPTWWNNTWYHWMAKKASRAIILNLPRMGEFRKNPSWTMTLFTLLCKQQSTQT